MQRMAFALLNRAVCLVTCRKSVMRSTFRSWWSQSGSNRRPPACKAGALPAELWPLFMPSFELVGLGRFELPTSRLSGVRSNHLSYRPLNNNKVVRKLGLANEGRETKTAYEM